MYSGSAESPAAPTRRATVSACNFRKFGDVRVVQRQHHCAVIERAENEEFVLETQQFRLVGPGFARGGFGLEQPTKELFDRRLSLGRVGRMQDQLERQLRTVSRLREDDDGKGALAREEAGEVHLGDAERQGAVKLHDALPQRSEHLLHLGRLEHIEERGPLPARGCDFRIAEDDRRDRIRREHLLDQRRLIGGGCDPRSAQRQERRDPENAQPSSVRPLPLHGHLLSNATGTRAGKLGAPSCEAPGAQ